LSYLNFRQIARPDKERSHLLDEARRLPRATHCLDAGRERKEFFADQADDEIVIVLVNAEARQANVVRVSGLAEAVSDPAVLAQDRGLFLGRQRVELSLAAQGIPDVPAAFGIGDDCANQNRSLKYGAESGEGGQHHVGLWDRGGHTSVSVVTNCGTPNPVISPAVNVPAAPASPEFLYWMQNASGQNPVIAVDALHGDYIGPPGLIPAG